MDFAAMDTTQLKRLIRELEEAKEDAGLLWTAQGHEWRERLADATNELDSAKRELERRQP